MIFDSFYVSLLSEEYKTGKKNVITASIIGALSNIYGAFSKKGFSSTIYIFVEQLLEGSPSNFSYDDDANFYFQY